MISQLSFQAYRGPLPAIQSHGVHVLPVSGSRDCLVVAALGPRPTTGFSIRIERLVLESDGSITVVCTEHVPKPGSATAQVVTYPAAAVQISREYANRSFSMQVRTVQE